MLAVHLAAQQRAGAGADDGPRGPVAASVEFASQQSTRRAANDQTRRAAGAAVPGLPFIIPAGLGAFAIVAVTTVIIIVVVVVMPMMLTMTMPVASQGLDRQNGNRRRRHDPRDQKFTQHHVLLQPSDPAPCGRRVSQLTSRDLACGCMKAEFGQDWCWIVGGGARLRPPLEAHVSLMATGYQATLP